MHLKLLASKRAIKKTAKVTGDLTGNKIADKLADSYQNGTWWFQRQSRVKRKIELNKDIPRKTLMPSVKRKQFNYQLRLNY